MTYDKNQSPIGWYVGSYPLRFVELAELGNDDPEKRFVSWENTALIQASSFDLISAEPQPRKLEASRSRISGLGSHWIIA